MAYAPNIVTLITCTKVLLIFIEKNIQMNPVIPGENNQKDFGNIQPFFRLE